MASSVYAGSLRYVKDVPESTTAANSAASYFPSTVIAVTLMLYVGLHGQEKSPISQPF